jgi:hypothetical protein
VRQKDLGNRIERGDGMEERHAVCGAIEKERKPQMK